MKRLQEFTEERWQFQALAVMDGVLKHPEGATEFILLLHGLNERGRRIYRKLLPYLPENAIILAPNGPFPLPRMKEQKIDYGFSWYFYDKFERKYYLNQDLAKSWIKELVHLKNPNNLPVTIIGFSQGGYLAPLVAKVLPQTKLVIGIGCEFRHNLIESPLAFPLEAIHGNNDEVIPPTMALNEISLLKERGVQSGWNPVENTAHEITPEVGVKVQELLEAYGKRSL